MLPSDQTYHTWLGRWILKRRVANAAIVIAPNANHHREISSDWSEMLLSEMILVSDFLDKLANEDDVFGVVGMDFVFDEPHFVVGCFELVAVTCERKVASLFVDCFDSDMISSVALKSQRWEFPKLPWVFNKYQCIKCTAFWWLRMKKKRMYFGRWPNNWPIFSKRWNSSVEHNCLAGHTN